jgi:holliday junction DNA helicase RuvA
MIAYIDGKLTFKDPTYVIVETNGIGYQIKISLSTYSALKEGEKCRLLTYLHIKEDAHTLFGFTEAAEKKLFMDLISISGVGPTTALMVLSSLSPAELQHAIISEDTRTIQNVKGIGAKTAQRIILELKDKMKKATLASDSKPNGTFSHNTVRNEALSALVTLGIPRNVAEKNVETILKKEGDQISLEQLIKLALKTA